MVKTSELAYCGSKGGKSLAVCCAELIARISRSPRLHFPIELFLSMAADLPFLDVHILKVYPTKHFEMELYL